MGQLKSLGELTKYTQHCTVVNFLFVPQGHRRWEIIATKVKSLMIRLEIGKVKNNYKGLIQLFSALLTFWFLEKNALHKSGATETALMKIPRLHVNMCKNCVCGNHIN